MTLTHGLKWKVYREYTGNKEIIHVYIFTQPNNQEYPTYTDVGTFNSFTDAQLAAAIPDALALLEEARELIASQHTDGAAHVLGAIDRMLHVFSTPF